MDNPYRKLLENTQSWCQEATQTGWLPESARSELQQLEQNIPHALFAPNRKRPLVVGFFGGTGVGKSTLLNRLANQSIARTGVERPTSREITLFLHETVDTTQLDEALPLESHRVARHSNDLYRDILWVDMPDIDSTAAENHDFVLEWLPQIDVVMYVVSPERYRDHRGWELLQQHGHQHAWLFVMNQWDRGDPEQLPDFRKQLQKAGFREPLVFCTDCRSKTSRPVDDDFDELNQTLTSLANAYTIEELEHRGIRQRTEELKDLLEHWHDQLGTSEGQHQLKRSWRHIWSQAQHDLLEGIQWPIRQLAHYYIGHLHPGELDEQKDKESDETPPPRQKPVVWDDWAKNLLQDTMHRFYAEADKLKLPVEPFRAPLNEQCLIAAETVIQFSETRLRRVLANPGSHVRRTAYAVSNTLSFFLPVGAIIWAGLQVLIGYYHSSFSGRPYLGTDFAVHSILLIGLAWLLPWFSSRKLKPSLEKAAVHGIEQGCHQALGKIDHEVNKAIETCFSERNLIESKLNEILRYCKASQTDEPVVNPTLARMLPIRHRSDDN